MEEKVLAPDKIMHKQKVEVSTTEGEAVTTTQDVAVTMAPREAGLSKQSDALTTTQSDPTPTKQNETVTMTQTDSTPTKPNEPETTTQSDRAPTNQNEAEATTKTEPAPEKQYETVTTTQSEIATMPQDDQVVAGQPTSDPISELEKFKRRLIRSVARFMFVENISEEEMWSEMKKKTGCCCRTLWDRMQAVTIKKLQRHLQAEDVQSKVKKAAQMTATDWLMYDMVLVHDKDLDIIGQDGKEEPKCLIDLFDLVVKHHIERLVGDQLIEGWVRVTLDYNINNRMCSPMMLQRRWYQLKSICRDRFYSFWFMYRGNTRLLEHALDCKPTTLQMNVANKYPEIVTAVFPTWEQLVEDKRILLSTDFEMLNAWHAKSTAPKESGPDIVLIEPQVETIDLDTVAESDSQTISDENVKLPIKIKTEVIETSDNENDDCVELNSSSNCSSELNTLANKVTSEDIECTDDDNTQPQSINDDNSNSIPAKKLEDNSLTVHSNEIEQDDDVQCIDSNDNSNSIPTNSLNIQAKPSNDDNIPGLDLDDDVQCIDSNDDSISSQAKTLNDNVQIHSNDSNKMSEKDQDDDVQCIDSNDNSNSLPARSLVDNIESIDSNDISNNYSEIHTLGENAIDLGIAVKTESGEQIDTDDLAVVEKQLQTSAVSENEISQYTSHENSRLNTETMETVDDTVIHHIQDNEDAFISTSELDTLPKITDVVGNVGVALDMEELPTDINNILSEKANNFNQQRSDCKIIESTDGIVVSDDDNMQDDLLCKAGQKGKDNALNAFVEDSIDVTYVGDGTEIIDEGIVFIDEDSGTIPEFKKGTDIKQDEEDEKDDYENNGARIDLKLLMTPLVYTKKLDHMDVFRFIGYEYVNDERVLNCAASESKPVDLNAVKIERESESQGQCSYDSQSDDESEKNEIERHSVKYSSWLLHKPRRRSYNPIQLCKNPDFNTRLKRLTVGFLSSVRNRYLLKKCKPLTIDVHKAFETKLTNNTLYLKGDHFKSYAATRRDCDVSEKKESQFASVVPSKILGLKNAEIDNDALLQTLEPTQIVQGPEIIDEPKLAVERNRAINLPNIEEIRRLNQKLLTAEITPMVVRNTFNKPPVTLVSQQESLLAGALEPKTEVIANNTTSLDKNIDQNVLFAKYNRLVEPETDNNNPRNVMLSAMLNKNTNPPSPVPSQKHNHKLLPHTSFLSDEPIPPLIPIMKHLPEPSASINDEVLPQPSTSINNKAPPPPSPSNNNKARPLPPLSNINKVLPPASQSKDNKVLPSPSPSNYNKVLTLPSPSNNNKVLPPPSQSKDNQILQQALSSVKNKVLPQASPLSNNYPFLQTSSSINNGSLPSPVIPINKQSQPPASNSNVGKNTPHGIAKHKLINKWQAMIPITSDPKPWFNPGKQNNHDSALLAQDTLSKILSLLNGGNVPFSKQQKKYIKKKEKMRRNKEDSTETGDNKNSENSNDTSETTYCCWARRKINNLHTFIDNSHLCPKPVCICCCREPLEVLLLSSTVVLSDEEDQKSKKKINRRKIVKCNFKTVKTPKPRNNKPITQKKRPSRPPKTTNDVRNGCSCNPIDLCSCTIDLNKVSEEETSTQINTIPVTESQDLIQVPTEQMQESIMFRPILPKPPVQTKTITKINKEKVLYLNSKQIANKPIESPIYLGKNKILLSTVKPLDAPTRTSPTNILKVSPLAANSTPPVVLPKGVQLSLLPNGEITVGIDTGVELDADQLASLPLIIESVRQQLNQNRDILTVPNVPTIDLSDDNFRLPCVTPCSVSNVIDLDNDGSCNNQPIVVNDKPDDLKGEHKSQNFDKCDIEDHIDSHKVNKNVEVDTNMKNKISSKAENVASDERKEDSLKNVESDKRKEDSLKNFASENQIKATEVNENEPTVIEKNQPNEQIDTDMQNTKDTNLVQKDILSSQRIDNCQTKEVTNQSNTNRNTLLSDLMEMSGISVDDISAPIENVNAPVIAPMIPEIDLSKDTESSSMLPDTNENPENIAAGSGLELNTITSFRDLKYAYENHAVFYKMDIETGTIMPINVFIKKNNIVNEKKNKEVEKNIPAPTGSQVIIDLTDDKPEIDNDSLPRLAVIPHRQLQKQFQPKPVFLDPVPKIILEQREMQKKITAPISQKKQAEPLKLFKVRSGPGNTFACINKKRPLHHINILRKRKEFQVIHTEVTDIQKVPNNANLSDDSSDDEPLAKKSKRIHMNKDLQKSKIVTDDAEETPCHTTDEAVLDEQDDILETENIISEAEEYLEYFSDDEENMILGV